MGLLFALCIAAQRNRSLWYTLVGGIPCAWIWLYFALEKYPQPAVLPWYKRPLRFPKFKIVRE
jgi:hypothetical protein